MVKANPHLIEKLKKYGAFDITACFNCGTCTAICPLSPIDGEGYEFPRIIIRYAILGLEDKLVSAPQLWQCYYCGDCSDSCPRNAEPGELMMAARRYAIARYSWGKIGKIFYTKIGNLIALTILTLVFLLGVSLYHGAMKLTGITDLHAAILTFIPKDLIHTAGLVLGAFIGFSVIANLTIMYKLIRKGQEPLKTKIGFEKRAKIWITTLISTFFKEMLAQLRYKKCEDKNRYYAHLALFWGFILDFAATGLIYMIDLNIIILSETIMRYTARTLGITGGILLVYGALYFIWKRATKNKEFAKHTHISDGLFLILLLLIGASGLALTTVEYLFMEMGIHSEQIVYTAYILFTLHMVTVFDLIVMAPFSKFAHAGYRPFALWIVNATNKIKEINETLKKKKKITV